MRGSKPSDMPIHAKKGRLLLPPLGARKVPLARFPPWPESCWRPRLDYAALPLPSALHKAHQRPPASQWPRQRCDLLGAAPAGRWRSAVGTPLAAAQQLVSPACLAGFHWLLVLTSMQYEAGGPGPAWRWASGRCGDISSGIRIRVERVQASRKDRGTGHAASLFARKLSTAGEWQGRPSCACLSARSIAPAPTYLKQPHPASLFLSSCAPFFIDTGHNV